MSADNPRPKDPKFVQNPEKRRQLINAGRIALGTGLAVGAGIAIDRFLIPHDHSTDLDPYLPQLQFPLVRTESEWNKMFDTLLDTLRDGRKTIVNHGTEEAQFPSSFSDDNYHDKIEVYIRKYTLRDSGKKETLYRSLEITRLLPEGKEEKTEIGNLSMDAWWSQPANPVRMFKTSAGKREEVPLNGKVYQEISSDIVNFYNIYASEHNAVKSMNVNSTS